MNGAVLAFSGILTILTLRLDPMPTASVATATIVKVDGLEAPYGEDWLARPGE